MQQLLTTSLNPSPFMLTSRLVNWINYLMAKHQFLSSVQDKRNQWYNGDLYNTTDSYYMQRGTLVQSYFPLQTMILTFNQFVKNVCVSFRKLKEQRRLQYLDIHSSSNSIRIKFNILLNTQHKYVYGLQNMHPSISEYHPWKLTVQLVTTSN